MTATSIHVPVDMTLPGGARVHRITAEHGQHWDNACLQVNSDLGPVLVTVRLDDGALVAVETGRELAPSHDPVARVVRRLMGLAGFTCRQASSITTPTDHSNEGDPR